VVPRSVSPCCAVPAPVVACDPASMRRGRSLMRVDPTVRKISVHSDGSCDVEVRCGGSHEVVSGFAGTAEATAWIARQGTQMARGGAHHQRYTRTDQERGQRAAPKAWGR
jgi:hypothetical protein